MGLSYEDYELIDDRLSSINETLLRIAKALELLVEAKPKTEG